MPTGCKRVPQAIRPPLGVRSEGSLLWEMSGRKGLYDAQAVLREVTREILYFSAAMSGVPDVGIDLKVNLLAGAGKVDQSGKIRQA